MNPGDIVYVRPGRSSEGLPMRVGRVVELYRLGGVNHIDGGYGFDGAIVRPLWPARPHPFGWSAAELESVTTRRRALWLWLTTTLWLKLLHQRGRV